MKFDMEKVTLYFPNVDLIFKFVLEFDLTNTEMIQADLSLTAYLIEEQIEVAEIYYADQHFPTGNKPVYLKFKD